MAAGKTSGGAAVAAVAPFSISREFKAPRALLWKVFTEPEHLVRWYGPEGATIIRADMDLRVGGLYHYGLRTSDGLEVWGKQLFQEVTPIDRFVVIQSFSDAQAGLTRHPLSPGWPLHTLATTAFEEVGPARTRVTITWQPHEASAEELRTFEAARSGMNQGLEGMFRQLEAYLAARQ